MNTRSTTASCVLRSRGMHENEVTSTQQFSSASFVVRAQKKLLSKVITRGVVKHFVSDAATRLFDNLFRVLKCYYSKGTAEKVVKGIIKLVVKLGVMARSEHFSEEQHAHLVQFQRQMHQLCLTLISFGTVAYSYDRGYLLTILHDTQRKLTTLVSDNLSEKSVHRLEMVFEHIAKEQLLDSLFRVDGEHCAVLAQITADLESLIDSRDL